ncbi:MAG: FKBP-type peptidyl-prolyl cis-trans isomerase [Planctomycetes bacterium]|nr:FKBP-type peptidyl-prolyl cis-trans isomerase [Planctomycetota bacterium]
MRIAIRSGFWSVVVAGAAVLAAAVPVQAGEGLGREEEGAPTDAPRPGPAPGRGARPAPQPVPGPEATRPEWETVEGYLQQQRRARERLETIERRLAREQAARADAARRAVEAEMERLRAVLQPTDARRAALLAEIEKRVAELNTLDDEVAAAARASVQRALKKAADDNRARDAAIRDLTAELGAAREQADAAESQLWMLPPEERRPALDREHETRLGEIQRRLEAGEIPPDEFETLTLEEEAHYQNRLQALEPPKSGLDRLRDGLSDAAKALAGGARNMIERLTRRGAPPPPPEEGMPMPVPPPGSDLGPGPRGAPPREIVPVPPPGPRGAPRPEGAPVSPPQPRERDGWRPERAVPAPRPEPGRGGQPGWGGGPGREDTKGGENEKAGRASVDLAGPLPAGYKQTPSGIRYKVLRAGEGDPPEPADTAVCHYVGWLAGREDKPFDSSYKAGRPAELPVRHLIKGFTEMLLDMRPGEKRHVVIPAALAYGARGSPPEIPANSDLQFEIELLKVK